MADRIRLEISGDSSDLVRAAAAAAGSIRALDREVDRANRNTVASSRANRLWSSSILDVNQKATLLRNAMRLLKWPALIAGAGMAAGAFGSLAASVAALTGALGPLAGMLVTLPGLLGTAAQSIAAFGLGTMGIADAVKAAMAAQESASTDAAAAMDTQAQAADRVADAKRSLTDAERQAQVAVEDLADAWADARREYEDLETAVRQGPLTLDASVQGLREARRRLRELQADSGATDLDREGARIAVREAQAELRDTRRQIARDRADLRRTDQDGGIRQMPQVVSARRALADAERAEADAARDLRGALDENTEALGAQSAAATKLATEMDKLPPAAQRFARFLISLKPILDQLRNTAAEGLLPGVEDGIRSALANIGPLNRVLGITARTLGTLARDAGRFLGSKAFGRDFERVGRTNARVMMSLGQAGIVLAGALTDIMVEAGPFLEWLGNTVGRLADLVAGEIAAARESGAIRAFFRETRDTLRVVGPMAWDFARALVDIARAGKPLGDDILAALREGAGNLREWTSSTSGQNTLRAYFADAKPAIFEVGRLVRDITVGVLQLGADQHLAPLIRQLRTELLPVLLELADTFASGFGPHFVDMLVSIAGLAGEFGEANGPLSAFVDLVGGLAKAVSLFMDEVPGAREAIIGLLTAFAVVKAADLAAKVTGIARLSRLVGGLRGGPGGGLGNVVSKAAPVPVFVTNPGFGLPGAGVGGGKPGAVIYGPRGEVLSTGKDAAKAGGLRGRVPALLGKVGPIARAAGFIAIGTALISGASAALGDKSQQAAFAGKVENFYRGALGIGARDLPKEAERVAAAILRGTDPGRDRRRGDGLSGFAQGAIEGAADVVPGGGAVAGLVLDQRTEDAFDQRTRRMLERLREARRTAEEIFGKSVVLKPEVRERDLFRIQANLRTLRDIGSASIEELRARIDDNLQLIARNMDVRSGAGRDAVTRNLREAIGAIKRSLDNGAITTRQAMREISRALETHSAGGKEAVRANFAAAVKAIGASMDQAVKATDKGAKQVRAIMLAYLESFGIKGRAAKLLVKTYSPEQIDRMVSRDTRAQGVPGIGTKAHGEARGGLHVFGQPGGRGPDTIPARIGSQDVRVGSGEVAAVFNRHQLPIVNARLADMGGLPGLFRTVNRPHYMAGGGIVALGRELAREGYQVGEHPAFGGVAPVHTQGSYHYKGMALDVNADNWPGGEPAALDKLYARLKGLAGVVELLWRTAGHFDHLHVAMSGSGGALPALAAMVAPKLPRQQVTGSGALAAGVQAALDIVRRGAQRTLDEQFGSSGAGGAAGSYANWKGSWPDLMAKIAQERGWNLGDWKTLVNFESGGNPAAVNPSSGAFGLGQFLGATLEAYAKYGAKSPDGNDQIRAMAQYIADRYGDPSRALAHWRSQDPHWYARGGLVGYIGDSLGQGTLAAGLAGRLSGLTLRANARQGRGSRAGVDVLKGIGPKELDALVFDLGTNDGGSAGALSGSIAAARALLGNDAPLLMATLFDDRPLTGMNSLIRGRADGVIDWASVAAPFVAGDPMGIHPNQAGYAKRAGMVAAAVRALNLDAKAKGKGAGGPENVPLGKGLPSAKQITRQSKVVDKLRKRLKESEPNKRAKRQLAKARERLRALKGRRKKGLKRVAARERRWLGMVDGFALEGTWLDQIAGFDSQLEDREAEYALADRAANQDDILTQEEVDDLVGRKSHLRGLVGGATYGSGGLAQLIQQTVLPVIADKLRQVNAFIDRLRARVRRNLDDIERKRKRVRTLRRKITRRRTRIAQLRDAIKRTRHKKRKTKRDKANLARWRAELEENRTTIDQARGEISAITERQIPMLEADNQAITGAPRPSRALTGLPPDTVLGGAEAVRGTGDDPNTLLGQQAALAERLRPGRLPSLWRNYDLDIADLIRAGATKPPPVDNSELLAVTQTMLRDAQRAKAVSDAQFSVFRGVLPLVGRYAQGIAHVPATGLALVHRDEMIVPDAKGPFGSQLAAAGAIGRDGPQITIVAKGDAAQLIRDWEVMVDGKLQRHRQRIEQRSRNFVRAPGRA